MSMLNQCPKCHVDLAADQDKCPYCKGDTTGNSEQRARNARQIALDAKEKDLKMRENALLIKREEDAARREAELKAAGA